MSKNRSVADLRLGVVHSSSEGLSEDRSYCVLRIRIVPDNCESVSRSYAQVIATTLCGMRHAAQGGTVLRGFILLACRYPPSLLLCMSFLSGFFFLDALVTGVECVMAVMRWLFFQNRHFVSGCSIHQYPALILLSTSRQDNHIFMIPNVHGRFVTVLSQ